MPRTCCGFPTALAALTLFAQPLSLQAAPPSGEKWEDEMTVEMAGMTMPLPTTEVCARPDEGNTPPVEKHCKLKDKK